MRTNEPLVRTRSRRILAISLVLLLGVSSLPGLPFGFGSAFGASFTDTLAADFAQGTTMDTNTTAIADAVILQSGPEFMWKNTLNPQVIIGAGGTWNDNHVQEPTVLLDGATYHMWYSGHDGTRFRIGHATSTDGVNWTQDAGNPLLNVGGAGAFDQNDVYAPTVIKDGGTFRMWYSGRSSTLAWKIGYATSPNGVAWTKQGMVLANGAGWEATHVMEPTVIKDVATFKMWYAGQGGAGAWQMGYATSADGVTWVKSGSNPVMAPGAAGSFDAANILGPMVIKDASTYRLWYSGDDAGGTIRVGYATSLDGVAWTKSSRNPVLDVSAAVWDSGAAQGPATLLSGTTFFMWYGGFDGANFRIGTARSGVASWGTFDSRIYDAGATGSSVVKLWFNASKPAGTTLRFGVRSGDTATPDASWSFLSPWVSTTGSTPTVDRGRYFQYRANFTSPRATSTPTLNDVGLDISGDLASAPTPTGPSPTVWAQSTTPTLKWTFNDPEGDTQTDYNVQVSTDPLFTTTLVNVTQAGSAELWASTTLPEGTLSWRVRTRDSFGIWSPWSAVQALKIDATGPDTPDLTSPSHTVGNWSNDDTVEVTLTGGADAASGLAGYSYVWDNLPATVPDTTKDADASTVVVTSDPLSPAANAYFHLTSVDNAGNWNATPVHFGPFNIDTNPPSPPTLGLTTGDPVQNNLNVALTIAATDDLSGVADMATKVDNGNFGAWIPYAASATVALSPGEGKRKISVQVRDHAGNVGSASEIAVTLDTIAPTAALSLRSGTNITPDPKVNLLVTGTDDGSGVADIALRIGSGTWGDWASFNENQTLDLTGPDGSKPISVRLRDGAGNIGPDATLGFLLDATPPTALSLVIDGGKTVIASPDVTLTLHAEDPTSGPADMSFSEGNNNWGKWMKYEDTHEYSLKGGVGDRELSFRVRDRAGNVAKTVTTKVTLGSVGITGVTGGDKGSHSAKVTGTMSGGPKLDAVEVRIDHGGWKPAVMDKAAGTWTFTWDTTKLVYKEHTVEARVRSGPESLVSPVTKHSAGDLTTDEPVEPPTGGGLSTTMIAALVGIIALVAVIGLVAMMRRKKKSELGPMPGGPPPPPGPGGPGGPGAGAPPAPGSPDSQYAPYPTGQASGYGGAGGQSQSPYDSQQGGQAAGGYGDQQYQPPQQQQQQDQYGQYPQGGGPTQYSGGQQDYGQPPANYPPPPDGQQQYDPQQQGGGGPPPGYPPDPNQAQQYDPNAYPAPPPGYPPRPPQQ